jgi:hypothetical protein
MTSGLLSKFKFTITHNETETEVFPVQDDCTIQISREEGFFFFRKRIKESLTLMGADYTLVKEIEDGTLRCLPITVKVIKRSDDSLEYTGVTYCDKCRFNADLCTVVMAVETQDKYADLVRVWELDKNILEDTTPVEVFTNFLPYSVIYQTENNQTISIGFPGTQTFPNTDWPDLTDGWVIVYDSVRVTDGEIPGIGVTATRTTRFAREILFAPSDHGDWVAATDPAGGYYNRHGSYAKDNRFENLLTWGDSPNEWFYLEYTQEYFWAPLDQESYTQFRPLSEVFDVILSDTSLSVESDFLTINPPGLAGSNYWYDDLVPRFDNLLIAQKTDVKYPNASAPATIGNITLKNLLKYLEAKLDTIVWIDGDVLRIEHQSFQDFFAAGIDWTADYPEGLEGRNSYGYEKRSYPVGEEWYEQEVSVQSSRFKKIYVSYSEHPDNCAPEYENKKDIVSGFNSDICGVTANPDRFSDEGFCLICAHLWNADDQLHLSYGENRYLTPYSTVLDAGLFNYKRPFYYGRSKTESGTGTANFTFSHINRTKTQDEIQVFLSSLNDFDEVLLHTTQIGAGEVEKAEYSLLSCRLSVTITHE